MLLENLADVVEALVEKILFLVRRHPLGHERAAAAHDAGDPVAHQRQEFAHHAGVNGHVVHALLGLFLDNFQHEVWSEIFIALDAGEGFVDRNGADRDRRSFNNGAADAGNIAARGQIHDGVRAVMNRAMQLLEFLGDLRSHRRIADIGVDLAAEGDADAHRLERAVMDIGGNNGAAAGHFAAHEFRLDLLPASDMFHFFSDDALTGEVHLRKITRAVCPPWADVLRQAFFNPSISDGHNFLPC